MGAERLPENPEWRYEVKLDGFVRLDVRPGAPLSFGLAIKRISPADFPAW